MTPRDGIVCPPIWPVSLGHNICVGPVSSGARFWGFGGGSKTSRELRFHAEGMAKSMKITILRPPGGQKAASGVTGVNRGMHGFRQNNARIRAATGGTLGGAEYSHSLGTPHSRGRRIKLIS